MLASYSNNLIALLLRDAHSCRLHTFANTEFCFYWDTCRSHNYMPDNAFVEKAGDCLSKDVNKQISETSSKIDNRDANDTRLSKMTLMCLNYKIRKAMALHTARCMPSSSEVISRYNWTLSRLLQSGEITTDTNFSELVKTLENSSIMKRMLCHGHMLAKHVFEEFMNRQCTDRAKRHKQNENSSINAKYPRRDIKEHEDDEREEGEI